MSIASKPVLAVWWSAALNRVFRAKVTGSALFFSCRVRRVYAIASWAVRTWVKAAPFESRAGDNSQSVVSGMAGL